MYGDKSQPLHRIISRREYALTSKFMAGIAGTCSANKSAKAVVLSSEIWAFDNPPEMNHTTVLL